MVVFSPDEFHFEFPDNQHQQVEEVHKEDSPDMLLQTILPENRTSDHYTNQAQERVKELNPIVYRSKRQANSRLQQKEIHYGYANAGSLYNIYHALGYPPSAVPHVPLIHTSHGIIYRDDSNSDEQTPPVVIQRHQVPMQYHQVAPRVSAQYHQVQPRVSTQHSQVASQVQTHNDQKPFHVWDPHVPDELHFPSHQL